MPACAILSAACKVEECDFVKSVRDNLKETKYGDATRSGKTWFLTLATTEAKNFHSLFLSLLCCFRVADCVPSRLYSYCYFLAKKLDVFHCKANKVTFTEKP